MRVLCDICDKVCNLRKNVNGNKFICWTCKNDKIKPKRYIKYYELFPKNEWPLPRVIECLNKKLIY